MSVDKDMYLASKIDGQFIPLLGLLGKQPATKDRTGVGRHKLSGCTLQADHVGLEYPLLLSKKVFFESLKDELLWMIRGETNIKGLKSKIWDAWADANGGLGPIYGKQWRAWEDIKLLFTGDNDIDDQYQKLISLGYVQRGSYDAGDTGYQELVMYKCIDQLAAIEDDLRNRTCSSRMVVNAWNVGDLPLMALTPCHFAWQLVVSTATEEDKAVAKLRILRGDQTKVHDLTLSMVSYQRSADFCLGVPFNVGCYSLLLQMFADVHGYNIGSNTTMMGDCHVYTDQIPFIQQQEDQWSELAVGVHRDNRPLKYPSVKIDRLEHISSITEIRAEDIRLVDYEPKAHVKYPVAV